VYIGFVKKVLEKHQTIHRRALEVRETSEITATLFGSVKLAEVSSQELKELLDQTLVKTYLDDQTKYRIIDFAFKADNGTKLAKVC